MIRTGLATLVAPRTPVPIFGTGVPMTSSPMTPGSSSADPTSAPSPGVGACSGSCSQAISTLASSAPPPEAPADDGQIGLPASKGYTAVSDALNGGDGQGYSPSVPVAAPGAATGNPLRWLFIGALVFGVYLITKEGL